MFTCRARGRRMLVRLHPIRAHALVALNQLQRGRNARGGVSSTQYTPCSNRKSGAFRRKNKQTQEQKQSVHTVQLIPSVLLMLSNIYVALWRLNN